MGLLDGIIQKQNPVTGADTKASVGCGSKPVRLQVTTGIPFAIA